MTSKIKIKDLSKNMNISKAELVSVRRGIGTWPTPEMPSYRGSRKLGPYGPCGIETVPLPE